MRTEMGTIARMQHESITVVVNSKEMISIRNEFDHLDKQVNNKESPPILSLV